MTTKFNRVVTYYEEVQLTKLFDPSNTWFCEKFDKLEISYLYLH